LPNLDLNFLPIYRVSILFPRNVTKLCVGYDIFKGDLNMKLSHRIAATLIVILGASTAQAATYWLLTLLKAPIH
jgi:hypothetical protein